MSTNINIPLDAGDVYITPYKSYIALLSQILINSLKNKICQI